MQHRFYDLTPLEPLLEAGFVLLTPNFRLARRVSAEWDSQRRAAGEDVWEPLSVTALESWLMQQWNSALRQGLVPPLVPLNKGQALELWQQVIEQEQQRSADYQLLRPAAAAELALQAHETLLRWQVDLKDGATRQQFSLDEDCATFLRWHGAFEARLEESGLATPAQCVTQLLQAGPGMAQYDAALLDFDDVPPLFRAALAALCGQLEDIQPAGPEADCHSYAFADKRSELEGLAAWAYQRSQNEPEATIGIVLNDMAADRVGLEYLLRREFNCLGEHYNSLPVNFSAGISLDKAPVVRAALAVLDLGMQEVSVQAVVALLQSRFLHLPDAESALANRFVKRLFDQGRESVELAELRYRASQVKLGEEQGLSLGAYLLEMAGLRELRKAALPSVWAERFSQVLDIWSWPGSGPLDSLEYQQVELWYRTLADFAAYDGVTGPVDYGAALQLLRRCSARQVSQPQTADSNIQVLGPLEAAGLAFDHLWLCGIQGSSWPAPARPNPLVPPGLQKRLQMPHASAEREWAFAAGLMQQYRCSALQLHASYALQLDGVPELPSALLANFSAAEPPVAALHNEQWLLQWRQRDVLALDDEQAPVPGDDELAAIGGGSGLLEDQSQCPFRAFARRRLKLEPLGEFSVALSASERGSILHDALYALWNEITEHSALLALDETAQDAAIQRAVQAALQVVPSARRRSLGQSYWQLESERLGGLLQQWLAIERQRGSFVVAQLEQDVELNLDRLKVRLRVDRIDQLPDGSQVIIDYKSGLCKIQDWLGDRPPRPQLLLYGVAAPQTTVALAFAQLRPRDCRFVGLGATDAAPGIQTDIPKALRGAMDAADWETLNQRWRDNLERLADEFLQGRAQVDPLTPASCTWCGLQPLCRIDHLEQASS